MHSNLAHANFKVFLHHCLLSILKNPSIRITRESAHLCLQAKLLHLDPGNYANQNQNRAHQNSPQLDIQNVLVEIRLCRSSYGSQHHNQDNISTNSVVLVQRLGVIDAAVQLWGIVLCEPNESLNGEKDVCDQTEDGVCRYKVGAIVGDFVVLDDD